MRGSKTLSRADRLLRSRKYSQVISVLESQVFLYRDNFTFYRLLGTACLYVGDFGGAYSYLQRAHQIRGDDTRVELGLAAVHLRRREIRDALSMWLAVLDRDPKNAVARRGLALVRRTDDTAEFVTMAESGRLARLFPPVGFALPAWVPLAVGAGAVAALGVVFLPGMIRNVVRPEQPLRDGVDPISATALPDELTQDTGEFRYELSDDEVVELVSRVGELFNGFRDNLARREANRLLQSNASPLVKERIRLVARFFREPTFVDFRDNFTYTEVASEPWLYDGVYVRWSGQTSNIRVGEEAITFTLLVGYETERVLEGTVPVTVPFAAEVQPGAVELIGRISYRDGRIDLTATGIRRIVPRVGS